MPTNFIAGEQWIKALNNIKSVDFVYIDYSKAFDSVTENRPHLKLKDLIIAEPLLMWIKNFETVKTCDSGEWLVLRMLFRRTMKASPPNHSAQSTNHLDQGL